VAAGLDVTRIFHLTLGSQSQKARPFPLELAYKRTASSESIALPFSQCPPFQEEFLFLLAHVMKHSSNGSQSPQLGELAAHLVDLKKSEALRTSQAPEIRKYLEQLNATQGEFLKTPSHAARFARRRSHLGKAPGLAGGIGLGLLLLGFLAGSLHSARQANARVDAVIAAMPTAAHACLLAEQRHDDKQRQWS
jgi:hypothetical protein